MSRIIGIDLGTANSRASVMVGGEIVVIPSAEGGRSTPSAVAFPRQGGCVAGRAARHQAVVSPQRTFLSFKGSMGSGQRESPTPRQLTGALLRKLKRDAEAYLGEPVTEAVITVPALYTDPQRRAVMEAAGLAELKVRRLLDEPSAAAMAFCARNLSGQNILVCHLGAGAFEFQVACLEDGVVESIATTGSTGLGGDDFDRRIVEWMAAEFRKLRGINLAGDRSAMGRLRDAAEEAKELLSRSVSAAIDLPYLVAGPTGPVQLELTLTRKVLEQLTAPLVEQAAALAGQALRDAGRGDPAVSRDIHGILLAGGCGHMPALRARLLSATGLPELRGFDPDEIAAEGAALMAGILSGDVGEPALIPAVALPIGLETAGGSVTPLVERNTPLPARKSQVFTTAADNQSTVELRVVQGAPDAGNTLLGKYTLDGIPPAKKGVPQIEVIFDIDNDGLVDVSYQILERDETGQAPSPPLNGDAENRPPPAPASPPPAPDEEGDARYRSLAAEYENYRRRTTREMERAMTEATAKAVEALLPVYDNLERALRQRTTDLAYAKGVELTMKGLRDALAGLGVEQIPALGQRFDPKLHNAVAHVEDPAAGQNTVVEVFQQGFSCGERVIRFAMVKVAN